MSRGRPGSRVVCIGGIDPSGGAGLVRDAWAAAAVAPEIPVDFVVSAWTWQGRRVHARARALEPELLRRELERVSGGEETLWVKLGLVPPAAVDVIAKWLRARSPGGVVLDPIFRASDGGVIGAEASVLSPLFPELTLVTPNEAEAEALGLTSAGRGDDESCAVLLKGAASSAESVGDLLRTGTTERAFIRERSCGPDPRGTGCALATAITCALAGGNALARSCELAIDWLDEARRRHRPGPDGRPHMY